MDAGAIILAGGKSQRMGQNKALLPFGETTVIETIISELKPLFSQIYIVTNEPEHYKQMDAEIITDIYKEKGPVFGVHAGLKGSEYQKNFVIACDMPYASAQVAEYLVRLLEEDAVIPIIGKRFQPLYASYTKAAWIKIEQELAAKEKASMKELLSLLKVRYVDEEELINKTNAPISRSFFNMNTPEDYGKARKGGE